ncbi:hypothetical protein MSPP1_002285 [Malassezia sp. CBS 17886]|nr:hypothetical protein MSPP1_002285 [Malassezia sp. CBS 17886]
MPPKKVPLSAKERVLFARLIQEYETKKYRLAIKTADAILKRFPEHGETLCLKGLVLFTLHEREEGLRLAKLGLRHDLTSFICWHALGIVYRMDRNYEESLKCYAQALRIEGGNLNLIRESAFMQLQLRNYAPLIEARLVILRSQPHLRPNWIALAVAHDLADNKAQAARILAAYEDVNRDIPARNYEFSEVVLYHASILASLRDFAGVERLLADRRKYIVDAPSRDALLADALQELGRHGEAQALRRLLVERNPEDREYIRAFVDQTTRQMPAVEHRAAAALDTLAALQDAFPDSLAVRRLALETASGDAFSVHARAYVERALVKNIPSLFSDVKAMYVDADKRQRLEDITEAFRAQWDPTNASAAHEPPSSYLWTMYLLAHHYSYIGQTERALQYIDSILAHSPAMPELHMTRARILKRTGAFAAASDAMEDARLLDGQDRYLNTKSAKYLLRVGRTEDAAKVLKLFTRPDVSDAVADLVEMQAIRYLVEDAQSHRRRGERALALKRFHQIDKIVADIYDDQLDFHSYCLRKMTLRAYVASVHFEDNLWRNPSYTASANGAVALYVDLHDHPEAESGADRDDESTQRDAQARAAEEAVAKISDASSDEPQPPKDPDPRGERLVSTKTPLDDAHKFIRRLQETSPEQIDTWVTTFDVAIRQRKWLLALRAVSLASRIDAGHPQLHVQTLCLCQALAEASDVPAQVSHALEELGRDIPALVAPSLEAVNTEYLQKYGSTSAAHMLGAAEGLYALKGRDAAPEAAALVFSMTRAETRAPREELERGLEFLRRLDAAARGLPPSSSPPAFTAAAHALWPHADAFQSADALAAAAEERAAQRRQWHENAPGSTEARALP